MWLLFQLDGILCGFLLSSSSVFQSAAVPGGRNSISPPSPSPVRCTKGSLREPFVQRAAAAPQLHKVLAALALRTTAVLQNSEKNPRYAQFFFGTSQSRSALGVTLMKP
jgi:hypothetical protein